MSNADTQVVRRVKASANLALETQRAILEGDEERAVKAAAKLMSISPEEIAAQAGTDEMSVRRVAHEIITTMLVDLVYSDDHNGQFWRRIMLAGPEGMLRYPVWISNAKWIRLFEVDLTNIRVEDLDLEALGQLGFVQQAKALGRFCATHDGTAPLPYEQLTELLDPRLLPFLTSWMLGTYVQCPNNVSDESVAANQAQAVREFLTVWNRKPMKMPASLMESGTPFLSAYREGISILEVAKSVSGGLVRGLVDAARALTPDELSIRPALGELAGHDAAILCPNWRDAHVAYRCLAGPTRAMLDAGHPALMIHEARSGLRGQHAEAWSEQTIEVNLDGDRYYLDELGQVASEVAAADLDFLFYPEITPSNCTALFATQRLARVQAAGYGFPVTTGSPHMDYFLGGADVECDGNEYCEQLILLPGFGVSTTAPPACSSVRQRPMDDERVRLVTIATHQKLNAPLLRAWDAILGDQPQAVLELFPNMTESQAKLQLPSMAPHLPHATVNLHPQVERSQVLDTLADADIYLDTFPFGGFNSLVEVLVAGCPVVTLEGNRARSRFGAAMLRRLGLPTFLIARTKGEYIASARRLIQDPGLRADIRAQIGSRERVLAALADPEMADHFAAAMSWMRERGPGGRKGLRPGPPVLIRAGEKPHLLCA